MAEDNEVPPLLDGSDDSDGWDEMQNATEQTLCLFCTSSFKTIAVALDHCRVQHNFDLLDLKNKYNMDAYSYIKMINFIRLKNPSADSLLLHDEAPWMDDSYLAPTATESWLMYDFDDLGSAPSTPHYAIDGKTPISTITYADLQRQIHDLQCELKQKDNLLELAMGDINKMKKVTQKIIEHGDQNYKSPNCVANVSESPHSDYFSSYSRYEIHLEMLSDKVRTEGYRDAIMKNAESFKDKVVLDVGCGTGILSMFAAKAGARKVYAVDQSDIIFKAMDIVRVNKLETTIELIHGRLEDAALPFEKADVLVSEWMGYFLLFEGMLDSVIYARDKYLKPDGLILPNRCNIQITACSDPKHYEQSVSFWDNVYGFDMSCMKDDVLYQTVDAVVSEDKIVATPCVLTEIDITKCTTGVPTFQSDFSLEIQRDCTVTALVGFFDTFFDLKVPVEFSTGPLCAPTHWKQTLFFLKKPLRLREGETLKGTLWCKRKVSNVRGLAISIQVGGDKYEYNVD